MAPKSQKPQSPLDAGYQAGLEARVEPSDFEMSFCEPDYRLGFVVGYSTAESIRQASPMAAAVMAGDLGPKYRVPMVDVLEQMALPDDLRGIVEDGYETESEPDDEPDDGDNG